MDNTNERMRALDVEGLAVTVDTVKAGSWEAFKLLRAAQGADDDFGKFDATIALMEYATDQTIDDVVRHCGGEDAQMLDVVRIVSQIVAGCYPKN